MADPKARASAGIYGRPGFKLRRAHQISQSIFMAECGALALTPTQYGVLFMLELHPGLDQISLARLLGLDRSTTGMVAAALGKRGLVFRLVDPRDKRKRAMRITPAGERLLQKAQAALDRSRERLLAPFSGPERQMFLALLDKLLAANNADVRVPLVARASLAASG